MSFWKKYPDHTAAIVALLIGAALASIGSYGINHPAECWPLASTLAVFYQYLLEKGAVSLGQTQIGGIGWIMATGFYWCAAICLLWFFLVPRNGGGSGGTSGGRRIVP